MKTLRKELYGNAQYEESQLSVSKVVSNPCGCTPRGVKGVKRSEILLEIQKYSLAGQPSSQNWIK